MAWKFDNNQPIYIQICNIIKLQIVTGQLQTGERLPSVRDLADIAGVNPNTIQRALSDLETQGFVYAKRTSGRFVTDNQELISLTRHLLAEEELTNFVTNMQNLGFKDEEILPELEKHLKGE
ncbi:GntR family transcriptional regulator [Streptococcus ovuberis]|uniref:GntR family transcriptional regulator n=1 Tax=Streptococcus ovuberis TaxID=1936207 RepID=A0A7X6S0R4_9STRE|nr:GntR family transcriptional regulator [Streptococcus ovuberis]NKZ20448.1 GntR family transcriptional regulator [Streptococcus ovuberis]